MTDPVSQNQAPTHAHAPAGGPRPAVPRDGRVVILATGGTIAGTAAVDQTDANYTAAQIGVAALVAGAPGLSGVALVLEQVAQVDSASMTWPVWRALHERCSFWLAQPDVAGIVVTHGTDTLEETAFFLHATLAPHAQRLPVVLTCAMRPASSPQADGPANLTDAVAVARSALAQGVLVACAGKVHPACWVQKVDSHRLDAFASNDPAGAVLHGTVDQQGAYVLPKGKDPAPSIPAGHYLNAVPNMVASGNVWPWVVWLTNHANASAGVVDALLAASPLPGGIVLSGTGNATVSDALAPALARAQTAGVVVWRSTRCVWGRASSRDDDALPLTPLPPAKAMVALGLSLHAR